MTYPSEYIPSGMHGDSDRRINPDGRDEHGTIEIAMISAASDPRITLKTSWWREHGQSSQQPPSLEALDALIEEGSINFPDPKIRCVYEIGRILRGRSIRLLYPQNKSRVGSEIYCRDVIGVIDSHAIRASQQKNREDARSHYDIIMDRIPSASRHEISEFLSWGNVILHRNHVLVGTPSEELQEQYPEYQSMIEKGIDALATFLEQQRSSKTVAALNF